MRKNGLMLICTLFTGETVRRVFLLFDKGTVTDKIYTK